ncbi:MAG: hypothetical protein KGJ06_04810, partial [Pseudomonadota bacterium]|nr:hypothetical protein [Pseudomonadota bacterium]
PGDRAQDERIHAEGGVMAKPIMTLKGMDGHIDLLADRVVIHREGLWNALKFGFNSRREIPISAISEVVFKPANFFRWGEIEFVRSGRSRDDEKTSKRINYNAVRFKKDQNEAFETFKEKAFQLLNEINKQR